jgi:hypothetical protein
MKYSIECPKCRKPIVQTHERLNALKVQTVTRCTDDKCGYKSAFIMDFKQILQDSPQLEHKLREFGMVVIV